MSMKFATTRDWFLKIQFLFLVGVAKNKGKKLNNAKKTAGHRQRHSKYARKQKENKKMCSRCAKDTN